MIEKAKKVAEMLKRGNVTIFSGAGLSTESGLMDFRSRNGIWAHVDPAEMCSVGVMEKRYNEFLDFYKARLYVPASIKPNAGHELIAKWEKAGLIRGIITQNIDELHQKAGSEKLAELHGSLNPIKCITCGCRGSEEDFLNNIPCKCGGHLRPNIVLFGEMLPDRPLALADKWSNDCTTFMVLGSSLVVSPANWFPRQAKQNGADLIIVNRDETMYDHMADVVAHESIGEFLTEVDKYM